MYTCSLSGEVDFKTLASEIKSIIRVDHGNTFNLFVSKKSHLNCTMWGLEFIVGVIIRLMNCFHS